MEGPTITSPTPAGSKNSKKAVLYVLDLYFDGNLPQMIDTLMVSAKITPSQIGQVEKLVNNMQKLYLKPVALNIIMRQTVQRT